MHIRVDCIHDCSLSTTTQAVHYFCVYKTSVECVEYKLKTWTITWPVTQQIYPEKTS